MRIYKLWNTLSSNVSVAVECTEEDYARIEEMYLKMNTKDFAKWIDTNYPRRSESTVRIKLNN